MQHLGHTRSSYQRDHLLQTQDAFVRAPLPGMKNATAIVHAAAAMGAKFTQYTAEFESAGSFETDTFAQRFLYVLEGSLDVRSASAKHALSAGQYAYVPSAEPLCITSSSGARASVIEKEYVPLNGPPPSFVHGDERTVLREPIGGDEALVMRQLLPNDTRFDFAVNTMTYLPGASLPMVEIHIMEHGLVMLEGEGIYRLNQSWYPVTAGDFIWMAPYCPQWFAAVGKKPAKYLIYKDSNRLVR